MRGRLVDVGGKVDIVVEMEMRGEGVEEWEAEVKTVEKVGTEEEVESEAGLDVTVKLEVKMVAQVVEMAKVGYAEDWGEGEALEA